MMYTMTYNDALWTTEGSDPTVYNQHTAKRIRENASGSMHVEYKNLFGKVERIACRTKRQVKEAMDFLSMFKKEENQVMLICAQYNVKMGKYQNINRLKRELSDFGFGPRGIKLLTTLN